VRSESAEPAPDKNAVVLIRRPKMQQR
jgi:hypothetical protein